MKRQTISLILLAAIALSVGACNPGNSADYSKAPVQTGGPEQGEWRNPQGTMLSLSSGNFTYRKAGASQITGTYTVEGTTIKMSGNEGTSMQASWPNENSPVTVNGENLTKTD